MKSIRFSKNEIFRDVERRSVDLHVSSDVSHRIWADVDIVTSHTVQPVWAACYVSLTGWKYQQ